MSAVDQAIQDVGLAATIVRSSGNLSTYAYISPKVKQYYERDALFPTDSGIADGDLLLASGNYYLVRSLIKDERSGEFFMYRAKLFICNNLVTRKEYNSSTKAFAINTTNISCLIIDAATAMTMSDRAVVMPGFSGKDNLYYLYAQSVAGITKNSLIEDDSSRSLRVSGNINPYFARGLVEVPVKIEG